MKNLNLFAKLEGFKVEVKDMRKMWRRTDYLVTPISEDKIGRWE